ncbi:MAG: CHRD domain-containing protein [Brucellaceae bacterium]|nr:CHRD domain-containing protein [Brucellaceae bacterium]
MKSLKIAAALILSAFLFAGTSYARSFSFEGTLSGEQENPPVVTSAKGQIEASYNTISKVLKWRVSYDGLSGAPTMAHFHGPASKNQNADVIIQIKQDALQSPMKGSEKLTKKQEKQLLSGEWYFNIHTEKNPAGEIRTQLIAK